jgi:hypothetical protein
VLENSMTKQKESYLNTIRELKDKMKRQEEESDAMRKKFLLEIVHLRERVYGKLSTLMYNPEDVYRYEAFKVEEVIEPHLVDLLNDRMERQREFYLEK